MARRTKEDAEKTRKDIMAAAIDLFFENGASKVTLQKIAERAGVTRGAVYWHFKDKADVLHAIADENFLASEELIEELSGQDVDNPLEALHHTVDERLDEFFWTLERRKVMIILTQLVEYGEEMSSLAERHFSCKENIHEQFFKLISQAKRKGRLSSMWEVETAACALQHLVAGFFHEEMEYLEPCKKRDKARKATMATFFKALEGE